jgi:hypothetical protein
MRDNRTLVVLAGDAVTLALVTLAGFASHDTLGSAGARMLSTFIPLLLAWLLLAPHLGVFASRNTDQPRQLWRPFWAMILAAPMAGFLRGVWLNAPVLPIFVVILGGVSALSILLWRTLYWAVLSRREASSG